MNVFARKSAEAGRLFIIIILATTQLGCFPGEVWQKLSSKYAYSDVEWGRSWVGTVDLVDGKAARLVRYENSKLLLDKDFIAVGLSTQASSDAHTVKIPVKDIDRCNVIDWGGDYDVEVYVRRLNIGIGMPGRGKELMDWCVKNEIEIFRN